MAIVLGVFTVFQIRNTPHYDVTLTVAGDYLYGDDDVEKIKNIINNAGDDINELKEHLLNGSKKGKPVDISLVKQLQSRNIRR